MLTGKYYLVLTIELTGVLAGVDWTIDWSIFRIMEWSVHCSIDWNIDSGVLNGVLTGKYCLECWQYHWLQGVLAGMSTLSCLHSVGNTPVNTPVNTYSIIHTTYVISYNLLVLFLGNRSFPVNLKKNKLNSNSKTPFTIRIKKYMPYLWIGLMILF